MYADLDDKWRFFQNHGVTFLSKYPFISYSCDVVKNNFNLSFFCK